MLPIMIIGLICCTILAGAALWSILTPARRLWPPENSTMANKVAVWLLTVIIFGSAIWLGIEDWNRLGWPGSLRWAIGGPLVLAGNVIVWMGVLQIGMAATSGEATGLRTGGLYRYSRNPQYLADIAILSGWFMLTASIWALPVIGAGIAVLVLAAIAEESWLDEKYADEYRQYRAKTPRFLLF